MMMSLGFLMRSLGTMGRTYRQEKEWGNKPSQKKHTKKKNRRQHYDISDKDHNGDQLYYEALELEAYEEEYDERKRKKQ